MGSSSTKLIYSMAPSQAPDPAPSSGILEHFHSQVCSVGKYDNQKGLGENELVFILHL